MTIIMHDLAGADPDLRFSPYCWRIRFALAHKGLPVRPLPGLGGEDVPSAEAGAGRPAQPAESLDSIWNGLVKMLGG